MPKIGNPAPLVGSGNRAVNRFAILAATPTKGRGAARRAPAPQSAAVAMNSVVDLGEARFWRDVERLRALGPSPLLELLAEFGMRHLCRTEIEAIVHRYAARLDPVALAHLGADRMPCS